MFIQPGKELLNRPLQYRQCVLRRQIPENAAYFQVKLLGGKQLEEYKDAVVQLKFPKITWRPFVVASEPFNWFEKGRTVEFKTSLGNGERLRGIVSDFDGKELADITANGTVWRWEAPRLGFFLVRFFCVTPAGKSIPIESETLTPITELCDGAQMLRKLIRLPRAEQAFVVANPLPIAGKGKNSSIFGSNIFPFEWDLSLQLQVIKLMNLTGHLRCHAFPWNEIERERGVYDWRKMDEAVALCEQAGFPQERLLANILGTPRWNSSKAGEDDGNWMTLSCFFAPKDLAPWGDFLAAAARRYPKIRMWELWNEPHLDGFSVFWQKSTPKRYVELMKTGYEALKKVSPRNTVISGGISMRYMPWYTEFLKEGGNNFCDMTGTHNGYDHTPFRQLEKSHNAPSHPIYETEWHTNLFDCRNTPYPTEAELSYWMLVNLANLLTQGKVGISAFAPFNPLPREMAPYKADVSGIQQVSGLFRTIPIYEPRHQAYALRVAVDLFEGKVNSIGAWTFMQGMQSAAAFESEKGKVLFFWIHDGNGSTAQPSPALQRAFAGKTVLDWEGNPVPNKKFQYRRVYYVLDPNLAPLAADGRKVFLLPTPRRVSGKLPLERRFSGYHTRLTEPRWMKLTHYEPQGGFKEQQPGLAGRYALEMTDQGIELLVEIQDRVHIAPDLPLGKQEFWNYDSLQFAIDTRGNGEREDMLEFVAGGRNRLLKIIAPTIEGELPTLYSEPGHEVKTGHVKIERRESHTSYRVSLPATALYPFQPRADMPLRFSLLVNDNNGKGREGTLEWGGGISKAKAPHQFGTLYVPTAPYPVAGMKDLRTVFQDAVITLGDTVIVKAAADTKRGSGVSASFAVVPGGHYRVSGEVRGSAGPLLIMCFGDQLKRLDFPATVLSNEWTKFSGEVEIPAGQKRLNVVLFRWQAPGASFEVRNFQVDGL